MTGERVKELEKENHELLKFSSKAKDKMIFYCDFSKKNILNLNNIKSLELNQKNISSSRTFKKTTSSFGKKI